MNLKRNLAVAIAGTVLLLSACGSEQAGAADDTPDAVLKEYIQHLNDGDVETALSLVADTGGLTASDVQTFEGIASEIPDLADSTEVTEDMTSVDLDFTFGSEGFQENVFFRKDEDGWKLSEPLYLTAIYGEQVEIVEDLQNAGYEFTTGEGQSVLTHDETHAYLPVSADPVQMSFEVQDTSYFQPFSWSFWLDTNGEIRNTMAEDEMTGEPNEKPETLADEFNAKIKQSAIDDYERVGNEFTTTVLEINEDKGTDGCEVVQTSGVDAALLEGGVEPLNPVEVVCHAQTQVVATTDTYDRDGQPVSDGHVIEVIEDGSVRGTIQPTGGVEWDD